MVDTVCRVAVVFAIICALLEVVSGYDDSVGIASNKGEITETKNSLFGRKDGTLGENLRWSLDDDGVLTISGTGRMQNFTNEDSVPWKYCGDSCVKSVVIEDGVESIGSYAFSRCTDLVNVSIPDSVTIIGELAFNYCLKLAHVVLPDKLVSIEEKAFCDCGSLTSIIIPNSVNFIGNYSFRYCNNLTNVTLSEGITSIGDYVFANTALTSITIPDSVSSIGTRAFYSTSLKSIIIPGTVKSIGIKAFQLCQELVAVSLMDGVEVIREYAFSHCEHMKDVIIPNSVISIEEYAFSDCFVLTGLVIPNSITTIEKGSFARCFGLTNLIIPNSVTSIKEDAFGYCSGLTTITIPESVSSIDKNAFEICQNLASVFYQGSFTINTDAFFMCNAVNLVCTRFPATSFGGKIVNNSASICNTFQDKFTQCVAPIYVGDDSFVMEKRRNVSEWENQTTGCMVYECDDVEGNIVWSFCNSTKDIDYECQGDRCVIVQPPVAKGWSVDIELEEGVRVNEFSVSDLLRTLSLSCKIGEDKMKIGYESDEHGVVVRVIVYVDDEAEAESLAKAVKTILRTRTIRVTSFGSEGFLGVSSSVNIHEQSCTLTIISIISVFLIHKRR